MMKRMIVILLAVLSAASVTVAQSVPSSVDAQIKQAARSKYPDDDEMQEYKIKEQRQAYLNVQSYSAPDLPQNVFSGIKRDAVAKYPRDYEMQEYKIREQVKAYRAVQSYSASDIPGDVLRRIRQSAIAKYSTDYEMQEYKIGERVKAYRRTHGSTAVAAEEEGQAHQSKDVVTVPSVKLPFTRETLEQKTKEFEQSPEVIAHLSEQRQFIADQAKSIYEGVQKKPEQSQIPLKVLPTYEQCLEHVTSFVRISKARSLAAESLRQGQKQQKEISYPYHKDPKILYVIREIAKASPVTVAELTSVVKDSSAYLDSLPDEIVEETIIGGLVVVEASVSAIGALFSLPDADKTTAVLLRDIKLGMITNWVGSMTSEYTAEGVVITHSLAQMSGADRHELLRYVMVGKVEEVLKALMTGLQRAADQEKLKEKEAGLESNAPKASQAELPFTRDMLEQKAKEMESSPEVIGYVLAKSDWITKQAKGIYDGVQERAESDMPSYKSFNKYEDCVEYVKTFVRIHKAVASAAEYLRQGRKEMSGLSVPYEEDLGIREAIRNVASKTGAPVAELESVVKKNETYLTRLPAEIHKEVILGLLAAEGTTWKMTRDTGGVSKLMNDMSSIALGDPVQAFMTTRLFVDSGVSTEDMVRYVFTGKVEDVFVAFLSALEKITKGG